MSYPNISKQLDPKNISLDSNGFYYEVNFGTPGLEDKYECYRLGNIPKMLLMQISNI